MSGNKQRGVREFYLKSISRIALQLAKLFKAKVHCEERRRIFASKSSRGFSIHFHSPHEVHVAERSGTARNNAQTMLTNNGQVQTTFISTNERPAHTLGLMCVQQLSRKQKTNKTKKQKQENSIYLKFLFLGNWKWYSALVLTEFP